MDKNPSEIKSTSSSSNSVSSLYIENMKLRKLLSLQQRAVLYRHSLMNVASSSYSLQLSGNDKNNNDPDKIKIMLKNNSSEDNDDVQTTNDSQTTVIETLPRDNDESFNQIDAILQYDSPRISCVFCPKVFTSPQNYSRHLALKHVATTANNDLWVSPFKTLEILHSNLNSSVALPSSSVSQHKVLSEQKQNKELENKILEELTSIRERLILTELELAKERQARESLEEIVKKQFINSSTNNPKTETQSQISDKVEELPSSFKSSVNTLKSKTDLVEKNHHFSIEPIAEDKNDYVENNVLEKKKEIVEKILKDEIDKKKGKEDTETLSRNTKIVPNEVTFPEENIREDVESSLSERLFQYIQEESKQRSTSSPTNGDINYDRAMEKIQRDRELLIQQTRHDYDFQDIESSLRDMIDTRVKQKLLSPDIRSPSPASQTENKIPKSLEKNVTFNNDTSNAEKEEKNYLKSILSTAMKKRNRPISPKKRITFSDQVVEFPFFKNNSEQSDSDDDNRINNSIHNNENDSSLQQPSTNRKNQMFIIREMNDTTLNPERAFEQNNYNQINGEKVYINDSTSSSSDDENNIETTIPQKKIPTPTPRPTTLSSFHVESKNSKTDAIAELVQKKLRERENAENKYPKNENNQKDNKRDTSSVNGLTIGLNETPDKYDIYDF